MATRRGKPQGDLGHCQLLTSITKSLPSDLEAVVDQPLEGGQCPWRRKISYLDHEWSWISYLS